MYMLLNNGEHPFMAKGDNKKEFIKRLKKNQNFSFVNKVSE